MRCGNRPEPGHAPPNNSHPCCRRLVARRSFQCGRATAIWSGRAAGSGGGVRGDVRRLPPLGEAPSAQRNVCSGRPSPRSRCAHRTGNRGWRASTGGGPAPAVSAAPPAASAPAGSTAVPRQQTAPVPSDQTAAVPPEQTAGAPPERAPAMFWPDAAADLVAYVLFPKGNDRFWAHGYDSIVAAAFAASDADERRVKRARPAGNQVSDATSPATAPLASADLCGNISATAAADALIERIERAIEPSASQRDVLEQLRAALAQTIERINATCPAAAPATLTERLAAIQGRIWAMHDALLTLRQPLESFD